MRPTGPLPAWLVGHKSLWSPYLPWASCLPPNVQGCLKTLWGNRPSSPPIPGGLPGGDFYP